MVLAFSEAQFRGHLPGAGHFPRGFVAVYVRFISHRSQKGVVMDAALLDAQRLRVVRSQPFPWTRGIIGAALGHGPVRPHAMRHLAIFSDNLVLVGRMPRPAKPPSSSHLATSAAVAPKQRRM